jgi:hypothetical protein
MRTQFLALIVLGLSIGWLAGLSVSPVAGSLIAGLLGLVGSLGAGASLLGAWIPRGRAAPDRTDGASPPPLDLRPAAVLALSIAVAVPGGIMARTHQIFAAPDGPAASGAGQSQTPSTAGVLFSDHLGDCAEMVALSRDPDFDAFRERVAAKSDLGRRLAAELSPETLRQTVRALCKE